MKTLKNSITDLHKDELTNVFEVHGVLHVIVSATGNISLIHIS